MAKNVTENLILYNKIYKRLDHWFFFLILQYSYYLFYKNPKNNINSWNSIPSLVFTKKCKGSAKIINVGFIYTVKREIVSKYYFFDSVKIIIGGTPKRYFGHILLKKQLFGSDPNCTRGSSFKGKAIASRFSWFSSTVQGRVQHPECHSTYFSQEWVGIFAVNYFTRQEIDNHYLVYKFASIAKQKPLHFFKSYPTSLTKTISETARAVCPRDRAILDGEPCLLDMFFNTNRHESWHLQPSMYCGWALSFDVHLPCLFG